MEERTSAVRFSLDQCMYGGLARKATTLSGTADGLWEGECRCDGKHQHQRSIGRIAGEGTRPDFATTRLAAYPSGLSRFLASRLVRTFLRRRREKSELPVPAPGLSRATRLSQWSRPSSGMHERGLHILNEKSVKLKKTPS